MAAKARGRGMVAMLGFLALIGGIVGGGLLVYLASERPGAAVDSFARAPIGCTTSLQFSETGTFYVFEESAPVAQQLPGGCIPTPAPSGSFGFKVSGPGGLVPVTADDTVTYAEGRREATSVASIEITEPGTYEVIVTGTDPAIGAAIGRDPHEGVDEMRSRAIALAIGGPVLGVLLLLVAGRRSKRAAVVSSPDGPGYGSLHARRAAGTGAWPPEPPNLHQVPVNPHLPAERAVAFPMTQDDDGTTSLWAPPSAADRLDR